MAPLTGARIRPALEAHLSNAGSSSKIVFFDGVCAVCDATVQLLLDRDARGRFAFAPLQGETAAALRAAHPEIPTGIDSLLLLERDDDGVERVSWYSTGILRIALGLGFPWSLAAGALLVPAFARDPLYRAFAATRYRVFGQLDSCRIPRPEDAARFLP